MKIVMIVLLSIIWYFIIGAFVAAIACKLEGSSPDEDDSIGLTLMWPLALLVGLFWGAGKLIIKISAGAYNWINESKEEKKKKEYNKNNKQDSSLKTLVNNALEESRQLQSLSAAENEMQFKAMEESYRKVIDILNDKEVEKLEKIFQGDDGKVYAKYLLKDGGYYIMLLPKWITELRKRGR